MLGPTLLAFVLGVPFPSQAPPKVDPIFTARTIKCEVGDGTSSAIAAGKIEREAGRFSKDNALVFDAIDHDASKARVISNGGGSDVVTLRTGSGVHFLEVTGSGNVVLYTVFAASQQGRYVLSMSRHVDLGPELLPSQYVGWCRLLPG